ncbi:ATP-binding response regulator [Pseudoalteromonas denitrificans]|uniref:histidine kinase n=1 Tax=Pseudoalteromonas denitrificans DSM 6059 TaxID=1123010 RepID=A0A1I1I6Q0_9GAMM|nr:hybrid sensor histidine kinase/response regulator [Pseudoalteromonas denitrificans]SFC31482.1 Histidine kinase-, DNA gyrase B-, and HSP90-like ATPase [Pseudoalteromonas denitrificans DSM 6059]
MKVNAVFSIFIVDDNPINIDLLRRYLEPEGFTIYAATGGKLALNMLKKIKVDLILLDIMMPEMDGYQLCQILKKEPLYEHIPIIFVTAKVEPEDLRKGFYLGAVDYITKPVHQDVLLARVNNQISIRDQLRLEKKIVDESLKMAELGKLVAGITHEVASPLGNMMLSVEYILQETVKIHDAFEKNELSKSDFNLFLEQLDEGLNLSRKNAKRATELITSFKQVAVAQCSNYVIEINLLNFVKDIFLTLGPQLKKYSHKLKFDIGQNILVTTYPGALSQVITNLVNNSLLHAFQNQQSGEISISTNESSSYVTMIYSDNGIGMNKQALEKAFDMFFTTKAGEGGSGLGLGLCRELVENELGGEITLNSEENKGTQITFKILKNIKIENENDSHSQ